MPDEIPMISIYVTPGRGPLRLEDMTKEELIAAVKQLGRELKTAYDLARISREMSRSAMDRIRRDAETRRDHGGDPWP